MANELQAASNWMKAWTWSAETLAWGWNGTGNLLGTLVKYSVQTAMGGSIIETIDNLGRTSIKTAGTIGEKGIAAGERTLIRACNTVEHAVTRTFDSGDRTVDKTEYFFVTTRDKVINVSIIIISYGCGFTALALNKFLKDDDMDSQFLTGAGIAGISLGLAGCVYHVYHMCKGDRQRQLNATDIGLRSAPAFTLTRNLIELPDNHTLLMRAALEGDCTTIQRLQRQRFDLETPDALGRTALHWAAQGKQQQALEWLWYYGCDLNKADANGHTPLALIEPSDPIHEHLQMLLKKKNRFQHEAPLYHFYSPEAFVFKGGGPKGIVYVGVLQVMEENGLLVNLRRVAGTSAGAITAILVGLGYSAREVEHILTTTNLLDFLDHPYQSEQELMEHVTTLAKKRGDSTINDVVAFGKKALQYYFSDTLRGNLTEGFEEITKGGGLCKGEKFLEWIEEKIQAKTGIPHCTFKEYRELIQEKGFKHLYIYASKMDPAEIVCFNSEDPQWDDVVIADAVRASMSIPYVFVPHILRRKTADGIVEPAPDLGTFLDGGIIKNLPIDTFDYLKYRSTNPTSSLSWTNHQTLAFNLVDPSPEARANSNSPLVEAGSATLEFFASAEDLQLLLNANHKSRTVNISNCGMSLVGGFFADEPKKRELIESGRKAVREFLENAQKLAAEHAEHDPRRFLSIFRPSRQVIAAPEDEKEVVSFQQVSAVSASQVETVVHEADGATSSVVDKVFELRERTTTSRRKLTDEEFNERRMARRQKNAILQQQFDSAFQRLNQKN